MHAAKECKASSVLSKFKEMEKRVANGEDLEDDAREYDPLDPLIQMCGSKSRNGRM